MTKSEARRDAILRTATEVFREAGFDRASMSDICTRVGYSKATVYAYFKSKEELLVAIALDAAQAEFDAVRAALDEAPAALRPALEHTGQRYLAYACAPATLAARRLMLAEAGRAGLGQQCYDLGPARVIAALGDLLHAAMDDGRLPEAGSELAARHLKSLLDAEWGERLLFQTADAPGAAQIEAAAARAVAVFLAAYGRGGAGAAADAA